MAHAIAPLPHSSIPTGVPQSGLLLLYQIQHSIPHNALHVWCSTAKIRDSQSLSVSLGLDLALLNYHLCCSAQVLCTSIPDGTLQPWFGPCCILSSFNTFCVLLYSTQHLPSRPPPCLSGCSPVSSKSSLPFKLPLRFTVTIYLITSFLNTTNWAIQHWNSNSLIPLVWMVWKYQESLLHCCTVYESFVSVFFPPDEMGDRVADLATMFDWYNSIPKSGFYSGLPELMFE